MLYEPIEVITLGTYRYQATVNGSLLTDKRGRVRTFQTAYAANKAADAVRIRRVQERHFAHQLSENHNG